MYRQYNVCGHEKTGTTTSIFKYRFYFATEGELEERSCCSLSGAFALTKYKHRTKNTIFPFPKIKTSKKWSNEYRTELLIRVCCFLFTFRTLRIGPVTTRWSKQKNRSFGRISRRIYVLVVAKNGRVLILRNYLAALQWWLWYERLAIIHHGWVFRKWLTFICGWKQTPTSRPACCFKRAQRVLCSRETPPAHSSLLVRPLFISWEARRAVWWREGTHLLATERRK